MGGFSQTTFGFFNNNGNGASNPTPPAGSNGDIQFNSDGAFGASADFFWDVLSKYLGVGTNAPSSRINLVSNLLNRYTTTIAEDAKGHLLQNSTIPTGYASVQNSPPLILEGQAWSGTAAQKLKFRILCRPAASGSTATGVFVIQYSIADGSYTDALTINAAGNATFNGNITGGAGTLTGQLTLSSTTRGQVLNRLTTAQRNAISSPTLSETIFCTDATANDASTGVVQTWNGSTWKNHW